MFIIVTRFKVNDSVNKAQHEAFCSPVNDDVEDDVVSIDGNFVTIGPQVRRSLVTEDATNARETAIPDPSKKDQCKSIQNYARQLAYLVTLPCIVRCSRASARSALAVACSSG